MVVVRDILQSLLQAFLSLVAFFAESTAAAGIRVDPFLLAAILIALTVWYGSGAWAASIAGSRRHSGLLHFILGAMLPVVYPIIILFAMDVKGARERAEELRLADEKKKAEEEEKRRIAEMLGRQAAPEPGTEATAEVVFDAAYFERIARDEQGNPTGPWRVLFGEFEIKVLRIVEPLPEMVLVEIEGRDGKPQKFRIPYAQIRECEPC